MKDSLLHSESPRLGGALMEGEAPSAPRADLSVERRSPDNADANV